MIDALAAVRIEPAAGSRVNLPGHADRATMATIGKGTGSGVGGLVEPASEPEPDPAPVPDPSG